MGVHKGVAKRVMASTVEVALATTAKNFAKKRGLQLDLSSWEGWGGGGGVGGGGTIFVNHIINIKL